MNNYSDGRLSRPKRENEIDRQRDRSGFTDSNMVPVHPQSAGRQADSGSSVKRRRRDYPADEAPRAAQPEQDEPREEGEETQQLATNRTVMLCCTMAAMCGPFALFLLVAEKHSRAIRHNSVQSAALSVLHLLGIALCLGLDALLGRVPVLGPWVDMICWFCYAAVLVSVITMRLKLMLRAWNGLRYDLPLLGWWLERYV